MKTKMKKHEENPLKSKEMIEFNLIRKEPNSLEMRAFLYQRLSDRQVISEDLKGHFKKEFPFLHKNVSDWDLNAISETDIRRIYGEEYLPKEIFYFKNDFNPDVVTNNNYKVFPRIFTRVCNVSFDKGGLIVMELYCLPIFALYDANGKCLYYDCYYLNLGPEGKVMLRNTQAEYDYDEILQYNGIFLEHIMHTYPEEDECEYFPHIKGRDIIPEMVPVGTFVEDNYDTTKVLTDEEIIQELKNNYQSYRFLQNYYKDNEELAIIAVTSNILAFTFLSERLQSDKDFVIKLITVKKKNQILYWYLNDELKADIEIVKVCISSDSSHIIRNIAPVSDRKLMKKALKFDISNLRFASEDLKNDKELILELARKDWRILLWHASKDLLSDINFISEVIACFNNNRKEHKSVGNNIWSLAFEDGNIDLNEVVKYLLWQYPCLLKHIAPTSNMKLICKSLNHAHEEDIPVIIDSISENLKKTKEFWITAVSNSLYMLKNAPMIYRQDKEVVLSAVRYDGKLIEFAAESLRCDPEIFLEAIHQIAHLGGARKTEIILHLIPYQLLADKTFIIKVIQDYPWILEYVPMAVKSDREFMLQVIKETKGWTITIVAPEFHWDRQFIVEAAKLNFEILEWLPLGYNNDKELFEMLKKEGIKTEKALIEVDQVLSF